MRTSRIDRCEPCYAGNGKVHQPWGWPSLDLTDHIPPRVSPIQSSVLLPSGYSKWRSALSKAGGLSSVDSFPGLVCCLRLAQWCNHLPPGGHPWHPVATLSHRWHPRQSAGPLHARPSEGVLVTYWSHQSDNRLVLASPRPIRAHLSSHGNVGFVFCCYSPPFTGHTICARKVQLCTQRHNNDSEHDISMD